MAERILVIKYSALGDFILALGPMQAIRKTHPQAHITLITTKLFYDMAQRSRWFDEIWVEGKPKWYDVAAWINLAKRLNAGKFDRVYDLQMNDRTKIIYRLFSKKPQWSGVIKGSPLFYPNPDWRAMHALERHREILKVAGIEQVPLPDLSWMKTDVSILGLKRPYVLLIPGSAPTRPEKRWPPLRYGALALKLIQEGFDVAVLGTAAERDVIEKIIKACPAARDLSGRTSFYDIAALAMDAAACVGNDTGPTHLCSMTGCPTVALFSAASDPKQSAPVGDVTVIQSDDLNDVTVGDVMKVLQFRKAA